jgi:sirohydrochlorin cobaltochelatase
MNGVILLAHGSRDPQWVSPFEKIRAAVESRRPSCAVSLAYLEHSTPDFLGAVDSLVARGATSIKVVPLFLGPGGHVRSDVPQLIERASVKHPRLKFDVKPFVGDASTVLDAIADYAAS